MTIEELEEKLEEERRVIHELYRELEKQSWQIDKHSAIVAKLQRDIQEAKNDKDK